MKDVATITWSHSSYNDIWEMYFKQFNKYFPEIQQYMFIDKYCDTIPSSCKQLINNPNEKYYKRFIEGLQGVKEPNVIYMQEDFILYDSVDIEHLSKVNDFLINSSYDFVRLIKSGVEGGETVSKELSIFEIPNNCRYVFSHQATIWKKEKLKKLYEFFRPSQLRDSELYGTIACVSKGIKGCYVYQNEPKRGREHYDSKIFPYVSTAVRAGKWDLSCYKNILNNLFEEYKIDSRARGIYEN